MMFLFAVPMVEAIGIMLLPQMLAARDLPFRLSAFAFWAYFVGGTMFFLSLFVGLAPDGGWFMYPPLTSIAFSPGINTDFWLLGIGFIEISAIAGAIEIIVGVLRTRAPGMTLDKMPMFAWAMLVFAVMIVVAFPSVILCTMLLEIERAFNWPFFDALRGGDPMLWQHLFWFFGHPEVYIIFIPAAGLMSMMVTAVAKVPLVGYRLNVLALVGYRLHQLRRLGASHVHDRYAARLRWLFFCREHGRQPTRRHSGILLDRHVSQRQNQLDHARAFRGRKRGDFHDGWVDRRDGGYGALRLASA